MRQNREFVMLAETLEIKEIEHYSLGNWYASEKLDGMRALWLPDTRGIRVGDLPFANLDKDVTGARERMASGLWSRYANSIWAPKEFLDQLPKDIPLDGELWIGRERFQNLMSIVREKYPGPGWANVKYHIFDSPSYHRIYQDGKIHNGQLKKRFHGIYEWIKKSVPFEYVSHERTFDHIYHGLIANDALKGKDNIVVHKQVALPFRHRDAIKQIQETLNEVLLNKGEGLIVRAPHSYWEPIRSKLVLKVKDSNDAEGEIIGFNMGTEGLRLDGMIGSLQVRAEINGKEVEFGLSGLTDIQRAYPSNIFNIGMLVTFRYRELTSDGVPKEARFLRIRDELS